MRAHHGSVAHAERRAIEEALARGRGCARSSRPARSSSASTWRRSIWCCWSSRRARCRAGSSASAAPATTSARVSRGLVYPKHRGDLLEATVVARGMREGAVEALQRAAEPARRAGAADRGDLRRRADRGSPSSRRWCGARRPSASSRARRSSACSTCSPAATRRPTSPSCARASLWDRAARRALRAARRAAARARLGRHHPGPRPLRRACAARAARASASSTRRWSTRRGSASSSRSAPPPGASTRSRAIAWSCRRRPVRSASCPSGAATARGVRSSSAARSAPSCASWQSAAAAKRACAEGRAPGERWLREAYGLDAGAAAALVDYVAAQQQASGALPTDRAITVERFRDELGDWRVCILSPFGARVHAPWALAIEARLAASSAGPPCRRSGATTASCCACPTPTRRPISPRSSRIRRQLEEQVVAQLGRSALFAGVFRENAARALLLPRRRPGARTPLFAQRLRAQSLLGGRARVPGLPDRARDLPQLPAGRLRPAGARPAAARRAGAARARRRGGDAQRVAVRALARLRVHGGVALRGRHPGGRAARAGAGARPPHAARPARRGRGARGCSTRDVIDAIEAELQGLAAERRARDAEALLDLLRRVGDLSARELAARSAGDAAAWLGELAAAGRALRVDVAGEARWIAAEDAGLYRDALGAALPRRRARAVPGAGRARAGAARAALRAHARTLPDARAGRAHAGSRPRPSSARSRALAARERLRAGEFDPRGREARVVRSGGAAPSAPAHAGEAARRGRGGGRRDARALPRRTGTASAGDGAPPAQRLRAALAQLEGLPLSFAELERTILPARVPGFDLRALDELGARGELVFVGAGALGERDLRVALYRRERVSLCCELPEPPDGPRVRSSAPLLAHLEQRGASFLPELQAAAGTPPAARAARCALAARRGGPRHQRHARGAAPALRAARGLPPRRRAGGGPRRWRRRGAGRSSRSSWHAEPPTPTRRAHARALLCSSATASSAATRSRPRASPAASPGSTPCTGRWRRWGSCGAATSSRRWPARSSRRPAWSTGCARRAPAARRPGMVARRPRSRRIPYGALLAVAGRCASPARRSRRAAGATLVQVDGAPALYLERGGRCTDVRRRPTTRCWSARRARCRHAGGAPPQAGFASPRSTACRPRARRSGRASRARASASTTRASRCERVSARLGRLQPALEPAQRQLVGLRRRADGLPPRRIRARKRSATPARA